MSVLLLHELFDSDFASLCHANFVSTCGRALQGTCAALCFTVAFGVPAVWPMNAQDAQSDVLDMTIGVCLVDWSGSASSREHRSCSPQPKSEQAAEVARTIESLRFDA